MTPVDLGQKTRQTLSLSGLLRSHSGAKLESETAERPPRQPLIAPSSIGMAAHIVDTLVRADVGPSNYRL